MNYLRSVFFLLFLFYKIICFAQAPLTEDVIQINWQGIQKVQISENDYMPLVSFSDALYDAPLGSLPVYYKRFLLNPGINHVTARISDVSTLAPTTEELPVLQAQPITNTDFSVTVKIRTENKSKYAEVIIFPFRRNELTQQTEKLSQCRLEIFSETGNEPVAAKKHKSVNTSVLSTGNIYKLSINTTGIYKITYDDLTNLGIDVSQINPKHIRIYGNGNGMLPESNDEFRYDDLHENAIYVEGESDGVFNTGDYILFYGLSPVKWTYNEGEKRFVHYAHFYSDVNCYFLTTDQGLGKRINEQASLPDAPTHSINTFTDYRYYEKDLSNLIHSGSEWYGEAFDIQTTYSFSFSFPNLASGTKVRIKTNLAARSFYQSTFNVTANGNSMICTIPAVPTSYTSDYAKGSIDTLSINSASPDLNISIQYNKPSSNSLGWLNYIEINATRQLTFTGDQLFFRNETCSGTGNITEFNLSNASSAVRIWDVTNPFEPRYQNFTLASGTIKYTVATDSLKDFVAYNGQSYLTPQFTGKINNQNLHGLPQTEFLVVSHPAFLNDAQRLASAHYNASGISCAVVTTDQVYNEFSSGVKDAAAIRDFVKMFYDRATNASELPKYLLLFGDGSYDNKSRTENNTAFIPTYQSANSLQPTASYVTDDFFGLLDPGEGQNSDGALDVGIGRFPVKTAEEAQKAVDKTVLYLTKQNLLAGGSSSQCSSFSGSISNYGDWRNVICFVADDEDGNLHISQAEYLSGMVDTINKKYNIDKIYFDSYLQETNAGGQRYPEVNDAISSRVEKGALIINYTGHGGEEGWAHERVLTVGAINGFNNKLNLPVFVTATCEFSRFDDPKRTSAGELLYLNPNGGAVSLFSTTRLAFANTNFSLNKSFYTYALSKINNAYPSLGELMKMSKNNIGNVSSIRNFVLLGDPALKLAYPEYNIVTTSIPDTLKALSKVTIGGYIADSLGNVLTDFNGTIYPTVFDKPSSINTLGNDQQSSVFTFVLQKNVLFKGKARVVNGYFTFDFIVPRDIAYTYGNGKISYYAEDTYRDANGYYDGFIIGGFDENYTPDNAGPDIKLYMNDESFVFGGITDENPVLLAILTDSSGINTTGNGIGHDVTGILDDDTHRILTLNDYYESELDSYQKGRIIYPFYNLELGLHNIKVKVWDVHNNSAEAYIEFYVTDSEELAIKHLLNYPNPFRDETSFIFEHNQTCNELTAEIQIYSTQGRLVKILSKHILSSGFQTEPIVWNGTDEGGQRLAPGVYIYKLYVTNCDGLKAEKTEKLILLK